MEVKKRVVSFLIAIQSLEAEEEVY